MPKVLNRCKRRYSNTYESSSIVAPIAFSAPPRKVSFEDGQSVQDENDHESRCAPLSPQSTMMPRGMGRKRSSLTRPKSSMSLVDLAKTSTPIPTPGVTEESSGDDTHVMIPPSPANRKSTILSLHHRDEQNPNPFPLLSEPPLHSDSLPTSPSSPWGQFVEMASHSEDSADSFWLDEHPSPFHDSCFENSDTQQCPHGCASCRRRSTGPYGNYHHHNRLPKRARTATSYSTPAPASFLPNPTQFSFPPAAKTPNTTTQSPVAFRLTPRQRTPPTPADQLVGALDRLHVNDREIPALFF